MGRSAAVPDGGAAHRVLCLSDRRIWLRSIRPPELRGRNRSETGPVRHCRVEVQTLVQVEPHTKSTLIDLEELPKPLQEQRDDARITVGELHTSTPFAALTGVQRDTGHEQIA